MQTRGVWNYAKLVLLVVAITTSFSAVVSAESPVAESPSYQMTDMQFGNTSGGETCSGSYCARASMGSMVAGESKSENGTSAVFGPVQAEEPLLEVIVNQSASDLGILSTERTATKTMSVKVRTYLSGGYVLQIIGDPPKYNGHSLDTPLEPTSSQAGKEQFGINAVHNTQPSIGQDPIQVPSGDISFGKVNDSYKTADKFMYSSGDTVAHSSSATGETDYVISMIVNISNKTPAGHYSGDFAAVVTPVY